MVVEMVPLKGPKRWDRWHSPSPNWQEKYHLYTTYSPCLLGGEKCYRSHLLGEPETTIDTWGLDSHFDLRIFFRWVEKNHQLLADDFVGSIWSVAAYHTTPQVDGASLTYRCWKWISRSIMIYFHLVLQDEHTQPCCFLFRFGTTPKSISLAKKNTSKNLFFSASYDLPSLVPRHFLLLSQGTFNLWRLSGLQTQFPSSYNDILKKVNAPWLGWTRITNFRTSRVFLVSETTGWKRLGAVWRGKWGGMPRNEGKCLGL